MEEAPSSFASQTMTKSITRCLSVPETLGSNLAADMDVRCRSDSALTKEDVNKSMTILLRTAYTERVSFGREPAQLVCKNCGMFVTTEISRHNGVCAFFTVLVALFLCTPCAWVPLVVPTCKDTLHSCPNCGSTVGVHRYFK